MGNCFRRCLQDGSDSESAWHGYGGQGAGGGGAAGGPADVDFTAVARDLFAFETTNKVPGLLGYYVSASKATQRIWFEKLLDAWKSANPAPASAEAVSGLIFQTLQAHHGIQVKCNVNAGDGDGLTVFVDVNKDARETRNLPEEIKDAVNRRRLARAQKDPLLEKESQKQIEAAFYKVFDGKNGGASCLARKYKVRLRGVDAPEIGQPYGKESRDVLRDLVKDQQLVIHVYEFDKYNRAVGDVYCHGKFVQEELLKQGSVWYYEYHDKREKLAKWERAAKEAGVGLWADANPEKPWDYRQRRKRQLKRKKVRSFRTNRGA